MTQNDHQPGPRRSSTINSRTGVYANMPTVAQPMYTGREVAPAQYQPRPPRTLILAFDGTSNVFDETNTNVVKLFALFSKHDPDRQLLYYQPGIGTYNANPGIWQPWLIKLAKVVDLATAVYLDAHICAGYKFLVDHYRRGDKICLFGFSRGAYTARCLAGMLHKVGLLTLGNHEQIRFAYQTYRDTSEIGVTRAEGFKRTFSRMVDIEFVGVWDTVSSVGVLYGRHLPFTSSNQIIKTFRHALALDERRAKFKANVWHRSVPLEMARKGSFFWDPEHGTGIRDSYESDRPPWDKDAQYNPKSEEPEKPQRKRNSTKVLKRNFKVSSSDPEADKSQKKRTSSLSEDSSKASSILRMLSRRSRNSSDRIERINSATLMKQQGDHPDGGSPTHECNSHCHRHSHNETDVLEVWFAGCHSDVGGGSVPDTTEHSLGGPSLRWMVREIIDANTGILFDEASLARLGVSPNPGEPRRLLEPKSEMLSTDKELDECGSEGSEETAAISEQGSPPRVRTVSIHEEVNHKTREQIDAMCPVHDELKKKAAWWILEYLPIQWHFQDRDGNWHRRLKPNVSRPRVINNSTPVNCHVSVKMRMEAGIGYSPRAKFVGEPNWVE